MKKPYEFKQAADGLTDLYVYGDITSFEWFESDVSAWSFKDELNAIETDVRVRINSYGGDVSEGLAIYSLLREFARSHKVTTMCDGFACSAASVIFMAGDERVMSEAGLILIHNAWSSATGNANDLRKAADDLEKITQPSINIYVAVTGMEEAEIKSMMDVETWITAQEAVDMHFATSVQKTEAQQSINDQYLGHAIMKIKELENKISSLENTKIKKIINEDPLDDFFNCK